MSYYGDGLQGHDFRPPADWNQQHQARREYEQGVREAKASKELLDLCFNSPQNKTATPAAGSAGIGLWPFYLIAFVGGCAHLARSYKITFFLACLVVAFSLFMLVVLYKLVMRSIENRGKPKVLVAVDAQAEKRKLIKLSLLLGIALVVWAVLSLVS